MMDRDQFWRVCIDTFYRGLKSRNVSLDTLTWSHINLSGWPPRDDASPRKQVHPRLKAHGVDVA
jgi:hypothetical protein